MGLFKLCIIMSVLLYNIVDANMKCFRLRNNEENKITAEIKDFTDSLGITNVCPTIIGSSSQAYCCYDMELKPHCCELEEFVINMSIIAVVMLIILMLLSTIVSCVCCLCCPFCYLYKRRHTGRVYRRNSSVTTNSAIITNNTKYQPITKSYVPVGAYQVLPISPKTEVNC